MQYMYVYEFLIHKLSALVRKNNYVISKLTVLNVCDNVFVFKSILQMTQV